MDRITAAYRLAMIRDCVHMAAKNLSLNKKRSVLTMLGVMIGVASIIALISLISAASRAISDTFIGLGTDTLLVRAYASGSKGGLTEEDLILLNQVEGVRISVPSVEIKGNVFANKKVIPNAEIIGKEQFFFQKNPKIVIEGRTMNALDVESKSKVCWISHLYVNELIGISDPVGATVMIQGVPFTVVGVIIPEVFISAANMLGYETVFIIPYTSALDLKKTKYMDTVTMYILPEISHAAVAEETKTILNQIYNGDDEGYHINDMKEYETSLNSLISMMTMLLIGTAGISLLVGGIGIMNMMLTTVSERTVEIGLKKAIGAYAWIIQLQFLLESVFLSLIGGGIGIILGFLISYVVSLIMDVSFIISIVGVLLGVGFSIVVGLIFGWTPAKKASRMKPIDALRSV